MTTTIRPEHPTDYATVADIHIRAFEQRLDEAGIVALQRQRPSFDPALSLVAERDGHVIGHALFTPCTVRLLGDMISAMYLAPIAVHPAYQGQNIGGDLITAGHHIAREKNIQMSFLLGHTDYYPRFGYQTGAFGDATVAVDVTRLPAAPLVARAPQVDDLPALATLWQQAESRVDFAMKPDATLIDWCSPHPQIRSLVYLRDDTIIGYIKYHTQDTGAPRIFLAVDDDAAIVAGHYGRTFQHTSLKLPLHPASTGAAAFKEDATSNAWNAAMAYSLGDTPLDNYLAQVKNGDHPAGRPQWPPTFDLA